MELQQVRHAHSSGLQDNLTHHTHTTTCTYIHCQIANITAFANHRNSCSTFQPALSTITIMREYQLAHWSNSIALSNYVHASFSCTVYSYCNYSYTHTNTPHCTSIILYSTCILHHIMYHWLYMQLIMLLTPNRRLITGREGEGAY